jgi:hypothetical protein
MDKKGAVLDGETNRLRSRLYLNNSLSSEQNTQRTPLSSYQDLK